MEGEFKEKNKKKEYKEKWKEAERRAELLESELKLVKEERDRFIGEKCLATAKFKENSEELVVTQNRFQMLENNYVKQKVEYVNLKSAHESLKEDFEALKKMLTLRDKEIQGLSKQQDLRRKAHPNTPTRSKDSLKPPNPNPSIRPFPSTSFSFNLISSSNKNSFTSSFREEDHWHHSQ